MSVDDLMKEYGVIGTVNKRKVDTYRGKGVTEYRVVFSKLITKGIEYGLDVLQDVTGDKEYTVNEKNLFKIKSIKGVYYWEIRIRHRGVYLKLDGKNNYYYLRGTGMEGVVKFFDSLNGKILNGELDTRIEQYITEVRKNRSKKSNTK